MKKSLGVFPLVGIIIFSLTAVVPGLIVGGFFPDWNVLSLNTWLIVAVIGGGISGLFFLVKRWYLAILAGMLCGPGVLLATYYYTAWRTSIFKLELVLPLLLGVLPGFVFFAISNRVIEKMTAKKDSFAG